MRNTNINPNVEKATSFRISQLYSWFVSILSMSSSTMRFINFKLVPPPNHFNECNNISVNEQANIGSDRQSFFAPVRSSFHMENVWAILFAEGGIFHSTLINITR